MSFRGSRFTVCIDTKQWQSSTVNGTVNKYSHKTLREMHSSMSKIVMKTWDFSATYFTFCTLKLKLRMQYLI